MTRGARRASPSLSALSLVALSAYALAGVAWADPDDTASAAAPSNAAATLLRIAGPDEFRLNALSQLWVEDRPADWNTATREADRGLIGHLAVEGAGSGANIAFAVEGQPDAAANRYCKDGACADVGMQIHSEEGLLYPKLRRALVNASGVVDPDSRARTDDFAAQRIEVSAGDGASGQTVYREFVVEPPVRSPFCEDYPDKDPRRFECVFNRPRPAPESWTAARETALVQGLPDKLVYAKGDYGLVFAEEFDGVSDDPNSCWNGMDTLDTAVWNYRGGNSCERVDSAGVPCESIADGHLRVAKAQGRCFTPGINTHGKFEYRYGYLEVKYRITTRSQHLFYENQNLVLGDISGATWVLWDDYGVVVDDHEGLARFMGVEVDVFEELPQHRAGVSHANINQWPLVRLAGATRFGSHRWMRFCEPLPLEVGWQIGIRHRTPELWVRPPNCDEIEITRGVEWTPRGYRMLLKVEGVIDDFMLWPESSVDMTVSEPNVSSSGVWYSPWRKVDSGERSRYFELLDADDADSRLDQGGIGHRPLSFSISSWGYPKSHHKAQGLLKVDYVRVFQPANGYADMEPVYQ